MASIVIVPIPLASCGSGKGTSSSLRLANEVCTAFHLPPGTQSGMRIVLISPTTAGKVSYLAQRFLGHGLAPWNQLPSDHFVADCGYANMSGVASAPTTTCSDGTHVSLQAAPRVGFYVDQEQRWSTDSLSSSITFPAC